MHVNLTARNDTGLLNTSPVTTMTPVVRLKWGCNHTITIPGMPVVLLIFCSFTFLFVCLDVCPTVLGGRGVIKTWTEVAARVRLYMLTSDLTSLVPPQFSHWLQVRKVGTVIIIIIQGVSKVRSDCKLYFAQSI